jgi:hypothetical protein
MYKHEIVCLTTEKYNNFPILQWVETIEVFVRPNNLSFFPYVYKIKLFFIYSFSNFYVKGMRWKH